MILKRIINLFIFFLVLVLFVSCSFSFMTVKVKGVKTYMLGDLENKTNRELSPFVEDGVTSIIRKYTSWKYSSNPDLFITIEIKDFEEEPKDYTVSGQVLSYMYRMNARVICITRKDTILNKKFTVSKLWNEGDDETLIIEEMGQDLGEKIIGSIGSDW